MLNAHELSSLLLILAAICYVPILAFLYLIGRFYEVKFGQRTHNRIFLAAAAVYSLMLATALLGYYTYELLTLANVMALAVLFIYGLRLYRMMMGVAK